MKVKNQRNTKVMIYYRAEDSHVKRTGLLVGNIEKNPLEVPRSCFVGVAFSSLRGANSETTHHLLSCFFQLKTQNDTAKAPAVDLLRLSTLRDTKTAFLTPKRCDEHSCLFYMGIFPRPPPRRKFTYVSCGGNK